MLAAVLAHVDVLDRRADQRENCRLQRRRLPGQRQHRSIVRGIRRVIEHADAINRSDGLDQCIDDLQTTAFADIGDALDDRHELDGSR